MTRTIAYVLVGSLVWLATALARDPDGRYAQSPLQEWFRGLTNKKSVNCCAESDGVRVRDVDWDREGKAGEGYRVRLCAGTECEWYDVPDDAVLDTPNRAGDPMVWRQWIDGKPVITCFLPGAGA